MLLSLRVGPLQENVDRLSRRRLELRPILHGKPGLRPQGQQAGVDHVGPRVDRQNRLMLFGLRGAAQHFQHPLTQDDVRLDQEPLSLAVQKDRPVRIERDNLVSRFAGKRAGGRRFAARIGRARAAPAET